MLVYDSRMIYKAIQARYIEVRENSSSSDEAQNEDNCRGKGRCRDTIICSKKNVKWREQKHIYITNLFLAFHHLFVEYLAKYLFGRDSFNFFKNIYFIYLLSI